MQKFQHWRAYHKQAKKLIQISLPILLAQIAQTSMGMVDTIMAGRVSAADMAAISVGSSIWLPLILFGQGLLLALPPSISYLNGAKQRDLIAHQVRQGFWIVIASCIPIGLIIYHSDSIIHFMDMEAELAQITIGYLDAMLFGLPAYLLMINFRCLNDGIAKTKPAMVINFIGLLLNIPLNYIFIYGKFGIPEFGAIGCGIATSIVNWLMCLLMIAYNKRAKNQQDLHIFKPLIEKPDPATLAKLLRISFPIAISIWAEVGLFSFISLFISPLGSKVVASHQVALNVGFFLFMFPVSLAMAATILVGQYLGEGKPQKAKQISYIALGVGLSIAAITAIITVFAREKIAMLFVTDTQVIAMASSLLVIAALYQFSDTIQVIISGVLRGYKDTRAILYITLVCYWLVGIPLGYSLAMTDWLIPHLGAKGFWIAIVVALTAAAILLFYRMRTIQAQPDQKILATLAKIK